ncbi:MAG: hypothetical protein ACREI3_07580, partial [Nitrospirales bacterium]
AYFAQAQAQGLYPAAYYPHNIHFLWQASLIEGRSQVALAAARKLVTVLPAEQVRAFPMVEPLLATPWVTLVQFGRWSDMLAQPAPPPDFVLQTAFWHYAQGMALAAQGQLKEAEAERAILESMEHGEGVRQFEVRAPMVPARRMVAIAHHVLAAELATRLGRVNEQIRHLEEAVRIEDGLPYMEPPYWPVPVRQILGPALLAQGRAKEAEAVFRADLTKHPRNGWSLFGLANSLRAQGKTEEAAKAQQQFEQAWVHADVTLSRVPR